MIERVVSPKMILRAVTGRLAFSRASLPQDAIYVLRRARYIHASASGLYALKGRDPRAQGPMTRMGGSKVVKGVVEEKNTDITRTILRDALSQGVTEVPVKKAEEFLRKYAYSSLKPALEEFRIISKDLGIDVEQMTGLARILNKSFNQQDRRNGRNLLLSASEAGSKSAVVEIVNIGLAQGELGQSFFADSLKRVALLAEADPPYIPAVILRAKVMRSEGRLREALTQYGRAIALIKVANESADQQGNRGLLKPGESPEMALDGCTAWQGIADILMRKTSLFNFDGGKEALYNAAVDYDDAKSYVDLAFMEEEWKGDGTEAWLRYRTKAAASGDVKSAWALGRLYSLPHAKIKQIPDKAVRQEILRSPLMRWSWRSYLRERWKARKIRNRFGTNAVSVAPKDTLRVEHALRWHTVAANGGYHESFLDAAKLTWTLGRFREALIIIGNLKTFPRSELVEQFPGYKQSTEEALQAWKESNLWALVTSHVEDWVMKDACGLWRA